MEVMLILMLFLMLMLSLMPMTMLMPTPMLMLVAGADAAISRNTPSRGLCPFDIGDGHDTPSQSSKS
jgi:hypothetical protein